MKTRLRPLGLWCATCLAIGAVVLGALPAGSVAASRPAAVSPARISLVLPLVAATRGLDRLVTAVSTPGSPQYRHYRSIAWLARHFGASAAAERRVVAFLRAHGASAVRVDATGLFVHAAMAPNVAARVFGTRLVRRANRSGSGLGPASPPRVPAALTGAVGGVVGLDTTPVVRTQLARPDRFDTVTPGQSAFTALSSPVTRTAIDEGSGYAPGTGSKAGCQRGVSAGGFTPNQYLTAYGFTPLQGAGVLGQGERVALIEVDGFNRSDITTFATCFGYRLPRIVGFRTDAGVSRRGLPPGGEATLDLEVLTAAAPRLSQIDVYESSPDIASVLSSLTEPLQNSGFKPEVISASLGLCEPDIRATIGNRGIADAEAALAEAAASGISILAASGDDGSADCVSSNTQGSAPLPELAVNYPSSSPYVTAVGGTNLQLNAANQITAQPVWNDDAAAPGSAGGGGRSILFARPDYQSGLASITLANRGLPDVAMLADISPGYAIYCTAEPDCINMTAGQTNPWQQVGGTSAATPLLAGGLALIDEQLRQRKQQGIGFANPLLYGIGANPSQAPSVFSDVTTGSNDVGPFIQASHQPLGCCATAAGFDLASGWGSVNLAGLSTQALAAEPPLVNVAETVPRQRPAAAGAIDVQVSCSGACVIGAFARVRIVGASGFTALSGLSHLAAAGTKLVRIVFTAPQRRRLAAAARAGRPVSAQVIGAIVDPAGNIERRTPARTLRILR